MTEKRLQNIVLNLVKDKGRVWEVRELKEYLKSQKPEIDNKMMIEIIERLADDFVFKWLDFISYEIPKVASTEPEFLRLLKKIANKIKGDLAQGPFIRALINVGESIPSLGLSLYEAMINDSDLLFYASFPLGGAGKKNFNQVFKLILKEFENGDPNVRATYIRSLRVIFEEESGLINASEIFQLLKKASDVRENAVVRVEAANAYLDFERFNHDECFDNLIRIVEQGESIVRLNVTDKLSVKGLSSIKDDIKILEICAQDNDEQVLWRVSTALARKGNSYPKESLRIIKGWIKSKKYHKIREVDYCLKEIGKNNIEKCVEVVETWVREDKNFKFYIPSVLTDVGSSNYGVLIDSIRTWSEKNVDFKKMMLETLRKVLSTMYPTMPEHREIIDSSFPIIEKIAREKGVDVEAVIRGEQDKLFQCLRIIKELLLGRQSTDFEKIDTILDKYPAIKNFLGQKWFQQKRRENNKTHPLLIVLSIDIPDEKIISREIKVLHQETDDWRRYFLSLKIENMLWPQAFLQHLEEIIQVISSKSTKLRDLRNGLKNEDQFWQTLNEMEVISSFIKKYHVVIAPKIDGKKLDAIVEIEGRELLIEIFDPKMFKPLRFLEGRAIGVPTNRIKNKIYEEFKQHLKGISIKSGTLVVIFIDIEGTEIDYDFIEDCFQGSLSYRMLFDKECGEYVGGYPCRADDSLHFLDNETDVISAVFCYKRVFGADAKFHFEGKIVINPRASNPLNSDIAEKIKETFLSNFNQQISAH